MRGQSLQGAELGCWESASPREEFPSPPHSSSPLQEGGARGVGRDACPRAPTPVAGSRKVRADEVDGPGVPPQAPKPAGDRAGERTAATAKGRYLVGTPLPWARGGGLGAADAPGDGGRWLSPCSSGATVHAPAVLPHSALPPPPRGAATRSRAGLRASALSKGGSPSRRLPPGPWPHAQPALEDADPHPAPPHRLSKFAGWRPDRRRGLCAAGVGVEGIRPVPASGSGSSRVSSQRLRQVK